MRGEARSELLCDVVGSVVRSLAVPAVWFGQGEDAAALRAWLVQLHAAVRASSGAGSWPRLRLLLAELQQLQERAQAALTQVELGALPEPQLCQLFYHSVDRSCETLVAWRTFLVTYFDELKVSVLTPELTELKRELDYNKAIADAICDIRQRAVEFSRNTPALNHVSRIIAQLDSTKEWFLILFRTMYMQFCKALFLDIIHVLDEKMQATIKNWTQSATLDSKVDNHIICLHTLCGLFVSDTEYLSKPRIVTKIRSLRENISALEKEMELVLSRSDRTPGPQQVLVHVKALRESLRTLELLCPKRVKISSRFGSNIDDLYKSIQLVWRTYERGMADAGRTSMQTSTRSMYYDQLGEYYIDKHGRKIYETDNEIYQVDQHKKLVPLKDDDRIYFYDDRGRYFVDKGKLRVYKHENQACDYNPCGKMIQAREHGDKEPLDHFGEYYYHAEDATHRPADGGSDASSRWQDFDRAEECPPSGGPLVMASNRYLQECVGEALKACLVRTVLLQPERPVAWLAAELEQYRRVLAMRERRAEDEAARQRHLAEMRDQRAAAPSPPSASGGSEAYSLDTNLMHYEGLRID